MVSLPAWLPTPIAAQATRLLESGVQNLGQENHARLIRLVCDPGMKSAWSTLKRAAPDEAALLEFFDQVRLHPAVLGSLVQPPALSMAQQRQAFTRIAKLASALLARLEHLGGDAKSAESGLAILDDAVRRSELENLSQISSGFVVTHGLSALPEEDEVPVSAVEMLRALVHSAQLAASAPRGAGPRKRRSKSALRTAYIQDLSRSVDKRFGKPFPSALAATIAVSLQDASVTEDLVRKLSGPKRKIPGQKRS